MEEGEQTRDTLEAERHRATEHVGRLEATLAASQAQLAQAEARIAGLEHSCADLQARLSDARAQASSAQSAADEHRDRARLAVDRVRTPVLLHLVFRGACALWCHYASRGLQRKVLTRFGHVGTTDHGRRKDVLGKGASSIAVLCAFRM